MWKLIVAEDRKILSPLLLCYKLCRGVQGIQEAKKKDILEGRDLVFQPVF